LLHIFVDADACPVKQEIFRVAERCQLRVTLVANSSMRIPEREWLELVVVTDQFDAADNWIVEQVGEDDIVISADIPLASRCLKKGAHVLGTTGRPFSESNIGQALATRELLAELRDSGDMMSGPVPFREQDRSQFLQSLDKIIQAIRKKLRNRRTAEQYNIESQK